MGAVGGHLGATTASTARLLLPCAVRHALNMRTACLKKTTKVNSEKCFR